MPRGRPPKSGYLYLDKKEILKKYIQGESVTQIARSLGISNQTIYNRFLEWGVKSRKDALKMKNNKKVPVTVYTAFIELGECRAPEAVVFGTRKEAEEYLAEILSEDMKEWGATDVMDRRLQFNVAARYNGEYYITERTIQVELI